jgi:large repetitive protein
VRDASTNGTSGNENTVYNGTTNATGTSTGGDGYYYIRFDMPPVPSRCDVVSATLALYAGTAQAATMVVQRATATWSDTSLTWNNQPALTGSPAPLEVTATGWHSYPVADHVTAFLAAPASNHGFVVRDQLTRGGAISAYRYQIYNSFSNASNRPTLTITWG